MGNPLRRGNGLMDGSSLSFTHGISTHRMLSWC